MHSFAWWPTLIVLAVATFTDLRNRRIPNWLVLPFLLAGIVVSGWLHGWHGVGQSFAGMGLGLLIYGFLFWMGWHGRWRREALRRHRSLDWPRPVICRAGYYRHGGRIHGSVLGRFRRISQRSVQRQRASLSSAGRSAEQLRDPELVLTNPLKRKMPYAPAIAIGTLISFFAH